MRSLRQVLFATSIALGSYLSTTPTYAAQVPDPTYAPNIDNPEYSPSPVVLFDHGHNNFHRADELYTGFRDLLTADGYNVRTVDGEYAAFDSAGLPLETAFDRDKGKGRILVVSNACGVVYQSSPCDTNDPALTDAEVSKILTWVRNGGSLLLIFDHDPYDHVANLVNAMGITIVGPVYSDGVATFNFTRSTGLNTDAAIANGRSSGELIDHVRVFRGDAFYVSAPVQDATYQPLLTLQPGAETVTGEAADGKYMGMAIRLGAGRIYISGEAMMFSAQLNTSASGAVIRYLGMREPDASYNAQYLRNVIHWLDGTLFDSQLDLNGTDLATTSIAGAALVTGDSLSIAYNVCNLGDADTTNSTNMSAYLSTDGNITNADYLISDVTIPPLAARECSNNMDTVPLPSGLAQGSYYIGSIVDYPNSVSEAYENNNTFTGSIVKVPGTPDLVITSVGGSTSGVPGGQMARSFTVKNQGTGDTTSSAFGVYVYLSSDTNITSSDYLIGTYIYSKLAAGATIEVNNVTITVPSNIPPGNYYYGAIADVTGNVPESNEANNTMIGNTITITP